MNGKARPFTDGCGLCSPGRWPPSLRQCAATNSCLVLHERIGEALLALLVSESDVRSLAFKLAAGRMTESPFSESLLEQARGIIFQELKAAGSLLPVEVKTAGQPFYLAAIAELLRLAGDPDHEVFFAGQNSFAGGVRLGVDVPLPRVPAVYTAKKTWRHYQEDEEAEPGLRDNYTSAKDNAAVVQAQFEKEAKLGAMIEITVAEAEQEWGSISVASLGALEKKDGSFRVIHDATRGLAINSRIKVQDQIRSPMAGDLKRAVQALPGACFVLSGDVARAHRLVKVARCDWRHQCCRTLIKGPEALWVNCVGSFGVASAAYHWHRLMAGLGRSAFYVLGRAAIMQLIYVDDLVWLVGEKGGLEMLIAVVFYYTALGLPFAWHKFKGGHSCEWVGFEVVLAERALGLTQGRADWITGWLDKACAENCVRLADLRAVLGRLAFAFTALPLLRPFLGPLYAWSAAVGPVEARTLPKSVRLIFAFIAKAMRQTGRLQPVGRESDTEVELFRTDARADGEEVWIGGWALDSADRSKCRWFAERLSRRNASWAFTAGEAYRAIATLELLATLAGVVCFGVPSGKQLRARCSAGTDNLGNTAVASKLLTTKFPLCIFLMELAVQLQAQGAELHLHWLPRLQNVEADQLTNGDFTGFSPSKRVRFCLNNFHGMVLGDLLEAGCELYADVREARNKKVAQHARKQKPHESLRLREPW